MNQKELRDLENLCIQECSPWCVSNCPVHVDVRSMCTAIAQRDFSTALNIFVKTVPFPRIISHICDHPCENFCKRREVGETIAIRSLERAAVTWGKPVTKKVVPLPARNKRVAIVGAGLSALTAAVDLSKRGYECAVLEATDRLGGSVWDYSGDLLPKADIESDLQIMSNPRITFEFEKSLGADLSISDLRSSFDAIYLGTGRRTLDAIEMNCFGGEKLEIDPMTFETKLDGVFAGGSIMRTEAPLSPITSISNGRRAAISIDRFLQGVSITASRENEGPYQTRLFTSTFGVDYQDRVPMKNRSRGYSENDAVQEALRCIKCECMECVKVCEFLSSFNGYPRKYIRQIYNNLSIVMGQRHGNKLINSCSLCGLCKEVCPESLHMGNVCKAAREIMVSQRKMPPTAHEFAIRDMEFSNSDKCSLVRHQPRTNTSAFLFFPGCRLSGSSSPNVERTYYYLMERLKGGVGLMLRCCGTPADWAGRKDDFSKSLSEFLYEWERMDRPEVITACSSCYSLFKTHLPQVKLVSLWETIEKYGLPNHVGETHRMALAIHDPCSSRHEPQVHQAVRYILKKLNYEIHELPLSRSLTECCGYGGLMCFANRDLAINVMNRRVNESPDDFVAYCAVCQDHFQSQGKTTWHLLDLIFGTAGAKNVVGRPLDYSQIRENRSCLRKSLLENLWKEPVDKVQEHQMIKLYIPQEIQDLMAQRMILNDDIKRVIEHAEKSGAKFVNRSTGHYLAHFTPAKVTYWVEYAPNEGGFTVHNAYSHRMQIIEESKS